jgi:hypothetical protein
MATKTNGAEFNAFFQDDTYWPTGYYVDDLDISVNGEAAGERDVSSDIQPTDAVTIRGGDVWSDKGRLDMSFEQFFRKWKKLQDNRVLLVSCPAAKVDDVVSAIRAAGGHPL